MRARTLVNKKDKWIRQSLAIRPKWCQALCAALTVTIPAVLLLTKEDALSMTSAKLTRAARRDFASLTQSNLENTVTVVTAYFNIGDIPATRQTNHKHPELYRRWLKFFRNIKNPTIGYFDDQKAAAIFREARLGLPTEIVMVNQSVMWAFSLSHRIQKIIDRPDYPKHVPNTVYAKYDCATHAKLEVVQHACRLNKFSTTNVAWVDVGEFREFAEIDDNHQFYLGTPVDYDDTTIAFDEVRPLQNLSVEQIMRESPVWIAAGLFFGKIETMDSFVSEYKRFTLAFLDRGLANAEQCIMMAMYSPQNPQRPAVGIQAYPYDGRYDRWFSLGYLLREQSLARQAQKRSKIFH